MKFEAYKKIVLVLLIALPLTLIAQSPKKIDSLLQVMETTSNDSIKLRLTNQVSFYFIFNDIEKALTLLNNGIKEANEKEFYFGVNELTNTKGIYFDVKGIKDSARHYFEKGLEMSRNLKIKSIEQMSLNNLGMYNWNSGNFQEALNYFYQALEMNAIHSPQNIQGESVYLNNIGLIYQELKQYEKALEIHQKALKIREEINLESEQAISLANMGVCFKSLSRFKESIQSYQRAITLAKSANSMRYYYSFHGNLANVYFEMEEYEQAIANYKIALQRPVSLGENPKSDLSIYSNLTAAHTKLNQPKIALSYAEKGFEIIEKTPKLINFAGTLYKNAAESNYLLGNTKKGSDFLASYISINDSIFSKNNAEAIAGLEVKFKTQEKEIQLAETRAELAEKELKIGRKNTLIYGTSVLALLLAILGYLLYKHQKIKNKQLQKENELKEALNQIATQNKLQEQRLRISRDLHDNIGAQLTFIISSIENLKYGLKLKNEKMSQKLNTISSFTTNTIYELRDTIWAMNKPEITIEDLKSRVINYIDKAREMAANINFEFKADDQLSDEQAFSSIQGMNIYRIIQEAVHNALKYAEATNIEVHMGIKDNDLILSVTDDGKGFNQSETLLGNGLVNMKKRAGDLGGIFTLNSDTEKGTNIQIVVPLHLKFQTKEAS
ncbi:sensor histidine kinase [uncultured Planktosalinus sp.]|mgnify:CR=1 FL=1|uniref:tetratricopeptide repeat-containing sensor histidine kinase n=1 Tax=uncultured Planktosalinus sp. TaxID=1810935 RepID=UPI0030DBB9EC